MKTNAAAAQADGSIIVVGSVGNCFAVARYHPVKHWISNSA